MIYYNLGTPALKPSKREIKTHQNDKKNLCKTGLAMNWKRVRLGIGVGCFFILNITARQKLLHYLSLTR